ncbi:MAG: galactokinase [Clostridiales bacterium]|jgi:galactokinase|nr:galactokinase [Clostridiales bacterium]
MLTPPRELKKAISGGAYDAALTALYPGSDLPGRRERCLRVIDGFAETFGERPLALISAPGRTEVGGNHTDHQRGMVLAAAVNLDILCAAAPSEGGGLRARVLSEGYPMDDVDLGDMAPRESERETSAAMIRGVAAWLGERGKAFGGFDAYTASDVLGGSGLSSSAAFEVAMGCIFRALYANGATPVEIAIAGQSAETRYFGKPSGLMDQTASSVGGFTWIDFADPSAPKIEKIDADLASRGLRLCIVDTKGSHANLTAEYAAIPREMGMVARALGKEHLREVPEAEFYASVAELREKAGDRAVLRAAHFFFDNALAREEALALRENRVQDFLGMVVSSGQSSFAYLQNVFSPASPQSQSVSVALALSDAILRGRGGAWRVHGGGFAGTVQAFVPDGLLDEYRSRMEAVFGQGACHVLTIRPFGGVELTPGLRLPGGGEDGGESEKSGCGEGKSGGGCGESEDIGGSGRERESGCGEDGGDAGRSGGSGGKDCGEGARG